MKIAYIILPFEASDDLVRCLNSIYRQTEGSTAIILSENRSVTENMSYFEMHSDIFILSGKEKSDEDKIISAVEKIPEDCDYVIFLSHNMTLVPNTVEMISALDLGVGIVVLKRAYHKGSNFSLELFGDVTEAFVTQQDIAGLCISRDMLCNLDIHKFVSKDYFKFYKYDIMLQNIPIKSCNDVCIYLNGKKKEDIDEIKQLDYIEKICTLFKKPSNNRDAKFYMLREYCELLVKNAVNIELDEQVRKQSFGALENVAEAIYGDKALERVFGWIADCDVDEISTLDYSSYRNFRNMVKCAKQSETVIKDSCSGKGISVQLSIPEFQNSALTENRIQQIPQEAGILNPVDEVPKLFAEGKLGFAIIWKSVRAWFAHKRGKR